MPVLLVVGAGFAGVNVAKGATATGFSVVIVDKKDFFDVKFASLRSAVLPDLPTSKNHIFPISSIPGIGIYKQGTIRNLSKNSAELESGEVINFDYAVIATGSTNKAGAYAQPQGTTIDSRRAELRATAETVKSARSVIIVGAGPLGVELAAEIVEAYAGKKVTLIHSGATLFENKPAKFGANIDKWLKEHKIQVVYNQKATANGEKAVTLTSGEDMSADLVIWTIGAMPNTQWIANTPLASTLDGNGRVRVDPTLRVVGYDNIFALGDINDVKEDKLGYLASLQAQLTAKNLATLKSNPKAKLKAWVPFNGTPGGFVTLGAGAGAGVMGSCLFPSCMVAMVKSKDLFVGKVRGDFGVK